MTEATFEAVVAPSKIESRVSSNLGGLVEWSERRETELRPQRRPGYINCPQERQLCKVEGDGK